MTEQENGRQTYPLAWPDGWTRTRPQDREERGGWKKTLKQYYGSVVQELQRMGATQVVVSSNVAVNERGEPRANEPEPRDTGVAVYFVRKPEEDFFWQDVLGVIEPAPSLEQIEDAYKRRAQIVHPDKQGGDAALWLQLEKAHRAAKDYVTGKSDAQHQFVIACDRFKQVRWNLCAVRQTLSAIRTIERCGTTSLMERAFRGFVQAQLTAGVATTVGERQ